MRSLRTSPQGWSGKARSRRNCMFRRSLILVLIGLVLPSFAQAQSEPWRFRWQKGQSLSYQVEQSTSAAEVTNSGKAESTTKLRNVKVWQVLEVDAGGIATLQMSLKSLRFEMTTPRGDLLFDSVDPS